MVKGAAILGASAFAGKFLADRLVGGEDGLTPDGGAPLLSPATDSWLDRDPGRVDAGDFVYWAVVGLVVVVAGALLRRAV
jgi:hypothetical protein